MGAFVNGLAGLKLESASLLTYSRVLQAANFPGLVCDFSAWNSFH